jgi:hypothetical protein
MIVEVTVRVVLHELVQIDIEPPVALEQMPAQHVRTVGRADHHVWRPSEPTHRMRSWLAFYCDAIRSVGFESRAGLKPAGAILRFAHGLDQHHALIDRHQARDVDSPDTVRRLARIRAIGRRQPCDDVPRPVADVFPIGDNRRWDIGPSNADHLRAEITFYVFHVDEFLSFDSALTHQHHPPPGRVTTILSFVAVLGPTMIALDYVTCRRISQFVRAAATESGQ